MKGKDSKASKSNVKHAVHKHESKMHPGEPKTKLSFGKKSSGK